MGESSGTQTIREVGSFSVLQAILAVVLWSNNLGEWVLRTFAFECI